MADILLGNEPLIVTDVPPAIGPELGEIPAIEFCCRGSGIIGAGVAGAITN